jgi:hypothetical protein
MSDKLTYKCSICGNTMDSREIGVVPQCCGVPMEELPACSKTFTAEWARGTDEDEPCNESGHGK